MTYILQPIDQFFEGAFSEGQRDAIGNVKDFSELSDLDFDVAARSRNFHVFCLIVHNPAVHQVMNRLLDANMLNLPELKRVLFFITTSNEILTVQNKIDFGGVSLEVEGQENGLLADVERYFEGKNLSFPGLLFFRSFKDESDAIYVPVDPVGTTEGAAALVLEATRQATAPKDMHSDVWADTLAKKLSLKGIEYVRRGEASRAEGMAKFLRKAWNFRRTIATVILGT